MYQDPIAEVRNTDDEWSVVFTQSEDAGCSQALTLALIITPEVSRKLRALHDSGHYPTNAEVIDALGGYARLNALRAATSIEADGELRLEDADPESGARARVFTSRETDRHATVAEPRQCLNDERLRAPGEVYCQECIAESAEEYAETRRLDAAEVRFGKVA